MFLRIDLSERIRGMPGKSITLDLPEELYEHMRQVAEQSQRPLERVALESLRLLFSPPTPAPEIATALAALPDYTDEQLWAVVYQRLPWLQSQRLHELSAQHKLGELTTDEQRELEALLALNDCAMRLRSEALLLLKNRGHDIETYLSRGA
jgi:hypothetical protein